LPSRRSNSAGTCLGVVFLQDKFEGLVRLVESDPSVEWSVFTAETEFAESLADLLESHGFRSGFENGVVRVSAVARPEACSGLFFDLPKTRGRNLACRATPRDASNDALRG
jgi:hypothetical protein